MLTTAEIAAVARKAANQARDRNAWNYDSLELAANMAAARAMNDFADLLELADADKR